MSRAQFYLSAAIVFALIVAVFAVQNTEKMTIYFLLWQVKEVSKVIVILASTAAGALVMALMGFMWMYKKIRYIRLLEAELIELKKKAKTGSSVAEPTVEDPDQVRC